MTNYLNKCWQQLVSWHEKRTERKMKKWVDSLIAKQELKEQKIAKKVLHTVGGNLVKAQKSLANAENAMPNEYRGILLPSLRRMNFRGLF